MSLVASLKSLPAVLIDVEILIEKGLLWLHGDSVPWEVHYAFFAKTFGQVAVDALPVDELHLFTPEDLTELRK